MNLFTHSNLSKSKHSKFQIQNDFWMVQVLQIFFDRNFEALDPVLELYSYYRYRIPNLRLARQKIVIEILVYLGKNNFITEKILKLKIRNI